MSTHNVQPSETDGLLRCPNDNSRMEKEKVGSIVIDRCNSCGRLWLDNGELDALLAHESTVKEADAGPFGRESGRMALGGRRCPRDGRELLEIKHPSRPDVLIEVCPGCKGVLLDAGELRQIKGASSAEASGWLKKMQKIVRW
ncbi:MAG: zf-TFIIB domain-containing protein [Phycisphaerales bacterium]